MQNTLTGEIERHVQRVMNTHSDFVWLSQLLHNATGEYISPTTLKRLWGHQTDYCHPSPYTLNLLSRYLGYADYDAFKRGLHADYASSAIQTRCYMSVNLSEGDVLTLTWRPDRRMLVRLWATTVLRWWRLRTLSYMWATPLLASRLLRAKWLCSAICDIMAKAPLSTS